MNNITPTKKWLSESIYLLRGNIFCHNSLLIYIHFSIAGTSLIYDKLSKIKVYLLGQVTSDQSERNVFENARYVQKDKITFTNVQ